MDTEDTVMAMPTTNDMAIRRPLYDCAEPKPASWNPKRNARMEYMKSVSGAPGAIERCHYAVFVIVEKLPGQK